jgi:AraC-like DNA-binding protein
MQTRIIRIGPNGSPPFHSPHDFARIPPNTNVCVIHELRAQQSLGGWWPACLRTMLQGRVFARSGRLLTELDDQTFSVVEPGPGPEFETTLGEPSFLVTLIPSAALLRQLIDPSERQEAEYPVLFAARYGRESRPYWLLRQLATECFVNEAEAIDDGGITERVLAGVRAAQDAFEPLIDRCPGRRLHHRRELFARLQRVRSLMESNFQGDIDIDQMGSIASLSPTHFIRVYKQVFGETPHRALARSKLDQAARLLGRSSRTITEIGRMLGFENRSAFARWYRKETGESASEARERMRSAAGTAPARQGANDEDGGVIARDRLAVR